MSAAAATRIICSCWRHDKAGVLGSEYSYNHSNENTGRVTFAKNLTSGAARDPRLDRSYEYDRVGRLWAAHTGVEARITIGEEAGGQTPDGPYSYNYHYDQWGNMTQRVGWGGHSQMTASYTNNRRAGPGYDVSGNLTSHGTASYSYDGAGRQASAQEPGYQLAHGYDGDGQRVRKVEQGQEWYYLRSSVLGGVVIGELNGTQPWRGTWHRGYIYLGGQQLAQQVSGTVLWAHSDPVTKAQRTTDTAGNPGSITGSRTASRPTSATATTVTKREQDSTTASTAGSSSLIRTAGAWTWLIHNPSTGMRMSATIR